MPPIALSLDMCTLQARYREGRLTPTELLKDIRGRIDAYADPALWIHPPSWDSLLARAAALEEAIRGEPDPFRRYPLFGLPCAVKDNIDWAGHPTTAACPAFAYTPERSAAAVRRLEEAGAIIIGKTNLDQFATGLVGTRSPYGAVRNPFHGEYISGGSSSGSAAAVAAGLVTFSLGTDTAGSGRVPAGFNNIVGLKPTRGVVSTRGVVPACRSLDCVSVFALTCEDAFRILECLRGDDDPGYTRPLPMERVVDSRAFLPAPARFRFGVPQGAHLRFFGQDEYPEQFRRAVGHLEALGGEKVEIPFEDFADTARLLYEGPWVAERWAAFGEMIEKHPEAVLPVIRKVVEPGKSLSAAEAFRAQYRLDELRARCQARLAGVDALVVPTAGTQYRLSEVAADPIGCNSRLGAYTNFVNLLDLCALAVPGGFQANGLPFGVTLIGLPFREGLLSSLGAALHRRARIPLGATGHPLPEREGMHLPDDRASVAVAGLHLSGQPLNGQLLELGARLRGPARTAPVYGLYALRRGERHFPGLVRRNVGGSAIAVEVWEMSRPALGLFFRQVKAPLVLGTVELESGEAVPGFLCESYGTEAGAAGSAEDITRFGGWLAYKAAAQPAIQATA